MVMKRRSKLRLDTEQIVRGLDRAEILVYHSISNARRIKNLQELTSMQTHARMFGSDSHTCWARTSVARHKSSARQVLFFVSWDGLQVQIVCSTLPNYDRGLLISLPKYFSPGGFWRQTLTASRSRVMQQMKWNQRPEDPNEAKQQHLRPKKALLVFQKASTI